VTAVKELLVWCGHRDTIHHRDLTDTLT